VERQWAVVDGHRGRVIATFPTEGEAYRTAYKKQQACARADRRKRMKEAVQQAANGSRPDWPVMEDVI
jgi:hypothetical protein